MFLRIILGDKFKFTDYFLENQMVLIVLGMLVGTFVAIKIAKILSKIKPLELLDKNKLPSGSETPRHNL